MIGTDPIGSSFLNPGKMCPIQNVDDSVSDDIKSRLLGQVSF